MSLADVLSQYIERRRRITTSTSTNNNKQNSEQPLQTVESSQRTISTTTNITKYSYQRTFRFGFFGLILQAPWNHYYYLFLDGWLPPTVKPFTLVTFGKVFIDQFVQAPLFTIVIFLFLGVLEGKKLIEIKNLLKSCYVKTMLNNWKVWIPATFVNLAFLPNEYRVLFINLVFFGWSIYLSFVINTGESVGGSELDDGNGSDSSSRCPLVDDVDEEEEIVGLVGHYDRLDDVCIEEV